MATPRYSTMLEAVMGMYDSAEWKDRVLKMPKGQVIAIYKTSLKRGVFEKKAKPLKPEGKQITIFGYFGKEMFTNEVQN